MVAGGVRLAGRIAAIAVVLAWSGVSGTDRTPHGIRFNHSIHYGDLDLDCTGCHDVTQVGAQALPEEEYCLGCHDGRLAPDECQACHLRPDLPTGYARFRSEIVFSHEKHMDLEGTDCLTCHSATATSTVAQSGRPSMETCFLCHDGAQQTIACEACHLEPEKSIHQIHPAGWREDHRIRGNTNVPSCEPCHKTDDRCSLCHFGNNLRGRIHPFNWIDLHAVEARARVVDCTACHETETTCVSCHKARLVLPLDHNDPMWLSRHGSEAQFDLESCDACHGTQDPSCFRSGCHGS